MSKEQHDYYSARALAAREMAQRATDRNVARIHAEMAGKYDELARPEMTQTDATLRLVAG